MSSHHLLSFPCSFSCLTWSQRWYPCYYGPSQVRYDKHIHPAMSHYPALPYLTLPYIFLLLLLNTTTHIKPLLLHIHRHPPAHGRPPRPLHRSPHRCVIRPVLSCPVPAPALCLLRHKHKICILLLLFFCLSSPSF